MSTRKIFSLPNLAKASIIILFLALVRCIAEVFRLQHYSSVPLTVNDIRPFLTGALIAATGLFSMTLLLFWERYKIILALFVLVLAALFYVKFAYMTA